MGRKEKSQRKWYRDFEFQSKRGIVWGENHKKREERSGRGEKFFLAGEGESWENKNKWEREKDYGESKNRTWRSTFRYRFQANSLFILFITLFFKLFGGFWSLFDLFGMDMMLHYFSLMFWFEMAHSSTGDDWITSLELVFFFYFSGIWFSADCIREVEAA